MYSSMTANFEEHTHLLQAKKGKWGRCPYSLSSNVNQTATECKSGDLFLRLKELICSNLDPILATVELAEEARIFELVKMVSSIFEER